MTKADRVLVRIAALKRQQAESQYQAVTQKIRIIDSKIASLREQIDAARSGPEVDVQLLLVSQKYVERLMSNIHKIERDRAALLPELAHTRHRLQKALFSESQLKEL